MSSCVVCGVEIEQHTASPDSGYGSEAYPPAQTEYQGATYQFCSSDHKERFLDNPEEFADSNPTETDE